MTTCCTWRFWDNMKLSWMVCELRRKLSIEWMIVAVYSSVPLTSSTVLGNLVGNLQKFFLKYPIRMVDGLCKVTKFIRPCNPCARKIRNLCQLFTEIQVATGCDAAKVNRPVRSKQNYRLLFLHQIKVQPSGRFLKQDRRTHIVEVSFFGRT